MNWIVLTCYAYNIGCRQREIIPHLNQDLNMGTPHRRWVFYYEGYRIVLKALKKLIQLTKMQLSKSTVNFAVPRQISRKPVLSCWVKSWLPDVTTLLCKGCLQEKKMFKHLTLLLSPCFNWPLPNESIGLGTVPIQNERNASSYSLSKTCSWLEVCTDLEEFSLREQMSMRKHLQAGLWAGQARGLWQKHLEYV